MFERLCENKVYSTKQVQNRTRCKSSGRRWRCCSDCNLTQSISRPAVFKVTVVFFCVVLWSQHYVLLSASGRHPVLKQDDALFVPLTVVYASSPWLPASRSAALSVKPY